MEIKDQLGRELIVKNTPHRIVSLVPSQTELLCDLGLEEKIAGVTKFCVHPVYIRKTKRVVGGTKQVHFNKIKELNPDIILCNKEENTEEMVLELEKIAPVHVSEIFALNDALELTLAYGKLFNKISQADFLVRKIKNEKEKFENEFTAGKKKIKVAYFIWREPWMLAGRNTFINTLLELNGLENVIFDPYSRYPEIDPRELKSLQPDIIMLSSEPFPFKEKHKKEILEHFKNCRVELVDGEFFSWYGSRLIPAFEYFRKFQMKLSNFL